MYLLFVDESGTHGSSHAFVLGGVAIHEDDAQELQLQLDRLVADRLGRMPPNLDEYELHASEMRNAKKPPSGTTRQASIWAAVPRATRHQILDDAYALLAGFRPADARLPVVLFGIAIDQRFHASNTQQSREQFAYEVLLNKFDMMLKSVRVRKGMPNRGLVIHDRRVVVERDIQSWTTQWRKTAGDIGQLRNLADVPLFADSRASRLLQLADLVSYSIYRRYASGGQDEQSFQTIFPKFHALDGAVHGCVHYTPSYGAGSCDCEPCQVRLDAEAMKVAAKSSPRTRVRTRGGAPTQ